MDISNPGKMFQTGSTEADRFPILIQYSKAESLKHSDSTVIGRTSADSDDKVAAAFFDGIIRKR